MEQIYKCPKCGENENLHFNYDYTMQHRPIKDVLCNKCGEVFDGNMPVAKLKRNTRSKALEFLTKQAQELDMGYDSVNEDEKRTLALFLRWFTKHYSTTNDGQFFGWTDSMGNDVTMEEILNHYYQNKI
jgi:hypothetical protein